MSFKRFFVITLMVVAGCATPAYTPVTHYLVEPVVSTIKTQPSGKTLGMRPLEAARPYKQRIAYRDPDFVLGFFENTEWAEMPAGVVSRVLRDAIVMTGRFSDVGDAGDLSAPDYILTGELRRFDLDRTSTPWAASCEIRLELRRSDSPDVAWSSIIPAREPLAQDALPALSAAMSKAVSHVVEEAVKEICTR